MFLHTQQVSPDSQQSTGKVIPAKSKGKKQTNSTSKPHSLQKPSILQPAPSTSAPVTQFGLMGYTSIHTQAIASFQSMTSHAPADALQISNPVVSSSGPDVSFHNQTPYPMFPPQPANAFMPMMYWPPLIPSLLALTQLRMAINRFLLLGTTCPFIHSLITANPPAILSSQKWLKTLGRMMWPQRKQIVTLIAVQVLNQNRP